MEKYKVFSNGGQINTVVDTIEEGEEIVNPDNERVVVYCDPMTFYYDNQAEADADNDGAYADSITVIDN